MIISCSTLGKNGRLGNQLFQVASTLGLAERYNAQAAFPAWQYEQYFENILPHGPMSSNTVQERYFHHHDWEFMGDTDVMGFLQSEKYFGSTRLKFKQEFLEIQKTKYPIFHRETICIQVRRGDYVGNPNYYQMPITFYICALLEHFPNWKDANILVVSDDVEYCKVHFGCLPNVTFTNGNTDIEDMALASLCDHFIISNSSFGWWCAWFGEKKHTKVVHSGYMFIGKLARKNAADYRPERWISYRRENYKIPLRDVTFTIPVLHDHPDRKANLDMIAYLILSAFDTNMIICEQGGNHFRYVSSWAIYMQETGSAFHRTKMLNDMCNKCETMYIANWDADVIVPPMQILLAVEALRAGADMVYPYAGGFARMPRVPWFEQMQKHLDIGIVKNTPFKHRNKEENSVGGCVMFNREAFIDGGMENQHFISFGPEDVERYNRFRTLGYKIERVEGCLFHMNHSKGINSTPKNPSFSSNVNEEQKVTAMNARQLREYVDSWPWRHQYTSRYYHEISEGSIRSAKIVIPSLPFDIKNVIDIGCGVGEWSQGFAPNVNYTGVDYRVDRSKLIQNRGAFFIECNLNRELPPLPHRKFDLVLCLEVAEHLHPSRAEPLVEYLCSLSDHVLFSAAIPFQGGNGHVNEQWQSWWGKLFWNNGFGSLPLPDELRCNKEIEPWYRQNMVLYSRGQGRGEVQDFVLPEYYEQIVGSLKR